MLFMFILFGLILDKFISSTMQSTAHSLLIPAFLLLFPLFTLPLLQFLKLCTKMSGLIILGVLFDISTECKCLQRTGNL